MDERQRERDRKWKERYQQETDQAVRSFMRRHNAPPGSHGIDGPRVDQDLSTAPPRTANQPYTTQELRDLAIKIGQSGVATLAEFHRKHGIPEWRTRRAYNRFGGLIEKIRKRRFKGKLKRLRSMTR